MILPNGRYCLIRDKYVDALGDLVVEAEYWRDEADFRSRPKEPREAHEHGFTTRDERRQRRPVVSSEDLLARILPVLCGCTRDDGHVAIRNRERHPSDPHGYLSHPHVEAIEVTAR
ncbi:MAG TPA: hypothetical protein VGP76_13235 [Planctomycetaceae bacterium]|jgi:hypothetical protein|nr:hypothetical protein [Planctomycetaceae bacterium]